MRADQEAVIDLMRENARLRSILTTIQELATDTPTKREMNMALNGIVRLCEDALQS